MQSDLKDFMQQSMLPIIELYTVNDTRDVRKKK